MIWDDYDCYILLCLLLKGWLLEHLHTRVVFANYTVLLACFGHWIGCWYILLLVVRVWLVLVLIDPCCWYFSLLWLDLVLSIWFAILFPWVYCWVLWVVSTYLTFACWLVYLLICGWLVFVLRDWFYRWFTVVYCVLGVCVILI